MSWMGEGSYIAARARAVRAPSEVGVNKKAVEFQVDAGMRRCGGAATLGLDTLRPRGCSKSTLHVPKTRDKMTTA